MKNQRLYIYGWNIFNSALQDELKNKSFEDEYNSLEPEYKMIQSLISARKSQNITQKELSAQTGIAQADISKLETGAGNPTIKLLKRIADALNMQLKIEFVPKSSQ